MKKMFITAIVLLILMLVLFTYTVNSVKKTVNNEVNKIELNIGKKIVIEKDTLLITDYSIIEQNYTLSNGKKISFKLIEKLQPIK